MAIPNTGDSGYYSEANVQGVTAAGLDPYFAVGRQKHHAPEAQPPAGDSAATPKDAMARKLQTPTGRALYAARKHIVEPVFGQIKLSASKLIAGQSIGIEDGHYLDGVGGGRSTGGLF